MADMVTGRRSEYLYIKAAVLMHDRLSLLKKSLLFYGAKGQCVCSLTHRRGKTN